MSALHPAISAAKIAASYLKEAQLAMGEEGSIFDLRLEEAEPGVNSQEWKITLGYNVPVSVPNNPLLPEDMQRKEYERVYTLFKIKNNEVKSMKIRSLG